ncbi:MAG: NTP transferase domain-containing protein, partial [Acidobacteria bacterium]|nr:NTP transferase domain-containing protein [Acidobacteriota bacterium]
MDEGRAPIHGVRCGVRSAIIPAAGRGIRMRPATRTIPKELLPVAAKPMIQHVIEEALASGIQVLCVVLGPGKQALRKHLEEEFPDAPLVYCYQPEPRGLVDAMLHARPYLDDGPFALLVPDNVFRGPLPALAQLLPFADRGLDLCGMIERNAENHSWFGNCGRLGWTEESGRLVRIHRLQDKLPGYFQLKNGRAEWAGFARHIFFPHFFQYAERARRDGRGELDDVPILQQIIRERGMLGYQLEGEGFDVGNPQGYAAANWKFTF